MTSIDQHKVVQTHRPAGAPSLIFCSSNTMSPCTTNQPDKHPNQSRSTSPITVPPAHLVANITSNTPNHTSPPVLITVTSRDNPA